MSHFICAPHNLLMMFYCLVLSYCAGEIAYTYLLARIVASDGIMVAAVCPGYCATNMSSYKGHRCVPRHHTEPASTRTH